MANKRTTAELLAAYGVTTVLGDRYGGEWPRERFRERGIAYTVARQSKGDLYAALKRLNGGTFSSTAPIQ